MGIPSLEIKIDNQTFELLGENNRFEISETLRKALHEAPLNQVWISYLNPEGKKIKHRIGNETIQAWQSLYQELPSESPPILPISKPLNSDMKTKSPKD